MVRGNPKLSIGLPVYNGEKFLAAALDSLLAQTFQDFEIVIVDNASSDTTEKICRTYAAREPRIRYVRNERNIGGPLNFNRAFELSRGAYFKWAASDDLSEPDFLRRCIEVLNADPTVVMCHPKTRLIDDRGEILGDYVDRLRTDSPSPQRRFHDMICYKHSCFQMFGVVRSDILRKVRLLRQYTGSDLWMLAELTLHGKVCEVPEFLFLRRSHRGSSWDPGDLYRKSWWNPSDPESMRFPAARRFGEFVAMVMRSRLSVAVRLLCLWQIVIWLGRGVQKKLFRNRRIAFEQEQSLVPSSSVPVQKQSGQEAAANLFAVALMCLETVL